MNPLTSYLELIYNLNSPIRITISVIYLILGLLLIILGRRLLRHISSFLAFALFTNIWMFILMKISSNTTFQIPFAATLSISIIIGIAIAGGFYYFQNFNIFLIALLAGFWLGQLLFSITAKGISVIIFFSVNICLGIILAIITYFYIRNIVIIINACILGSLICRDGISNLTEIWDGSIIQLSYYNFNVGGFWGILAGSIVFGIIGAWIQSKTFKHYNVFKNKSGDGDSAYRLNLLS